jgi:hypothetical protein
MRESLLRVAHAYIEITCNCVGEERRFPEYGIYDEHGNEWVQAESESCFFAKWTHVRTECSEAGLHLAACSTNKTRLFLLESSI